MKARKKAAFSSMRSSQYSVLLIYLLFVGVQVCRASAGDSKSVATPTEKSPATNLSRQKEKTSTSTLDPPKSTAGLFKGLKISIVLPGPLETYPLRSDTIFSDGRLRSFFRPCTNDSEAGETPLRADLEHRKCFRQSAYTDRLSLRIEFDENALAKSTVTLEASNLTADGSITNVTIQKSNVFTFSAENHIHPLTIVYNCLSGKDGTTTVSTLLKFQNATSQASITLSWDKVCRGGRPDHVIAFVKSHLLQTIWPRSPSSPKLEVAPSVSSTTIVVKLRPDLAYSQQAYTTPKVTVGSSSILQAKIRGSGFRGGVLQTVKSAEITVVYECEKSGKSTVSLTMGIPPFSNFNALWTKECGGRVANSLIGTAPKTSDVVQNGVVQNQYSVTSVHIGTPHSNEHIHLANNQTFFKIYIWLQGDDKGSLTATEGLHMGYPVLTVGDDSVIYASTSQLFSISNTGRRRFFRHQDNNSIVRQGEELELSFFVICKKVGESRVVVTLPLTHFHALEFGFAKKCNKLRIPRFHQGSAVTTSFLGTFLVIFGALACAAAIAFGCYKYRQRWIEYKRVPVGQR